MTKYKYVRPKAITMWDFSWLERRWPGAGYENWEQALDELVLRGYDAVRIDAYPHLLAAGPHREWTLKPEWDQQVWGAPAITRIDNVQDNLLEFISLCRDRGIAVALSTWFREDLDNTRMTLNTPDDLADIWIATLDVIAKAGLMDAILFVDLCNEYPLDCWAPFLKNDSEYKALVKEGIYTQGQGIPRTSPIAARWMNQSIAKVRDKYPDLDYTFSQTGGYDNVDEQDISSLDILEPHLWMANHTEYYSLVDYNYERFDSRGYTNLALYGEEIYRSKASYWDDKLREGVTMLAYWSRRTGKALVTTECWSVVDYKDWPLLNWDWIKHLCEVGVKQAVSEGRWVAIATSNFCGPQFVGMWRDISWHQRLTDLIKSGKLPVDNT